MTRWIRDTSRYNPRLVARIRVTPKTWIAEYITVDIEYSGAGNDYYVTVSLPGVPILEWEQQRELWRGFARATQETSRRLHMLANATERLTPPVPAALRWLQKASKAVSG